MVDPAKPMDLFKRNPEFEDVRQNRTVICCELGSKDVRCEMIRGDAEVDLEPIF